MKLIIVKFIRESDNFDDGVICLINFKQEIEIFNRLIFIIYSFLVFRGDLKMFIFSSCNFFGVNINSFVFINKSFKIFCGELVIWGYFCKYIIGINNLSCIYQCSWLSRGIDSEKMI